MQKSLKQIKQNEHTHTCRHTYIYTHETLKILNKFPTIVLSLLKGIYMNDESYNISSSLQGGIYE